MIVIIIIGVSGDDDETVAATTTTTAAVDETTTTVVDATTTTEAPVVDPTPGALGAVVVPAGEEIQIRSLQAITGDVAFLGVPNLRGTELAIGDFGPIQGFNVNLGTPLDDLCSAEGGLAAAQAIAADEQVVGTIGTSCSGAATGAMPLISESGGVMISPSNTSPALSSDLAGTAGDNYHAGYYRTAHNDCTKVQQCEVRLRRTRPDKAAAIHDGDPYTQGLAQAFSDAFIAAGGQVVVFTAVTKGDTDMTGCLDGGRCRRS